MTVRTTAVRGAVGPKEAACAGHQPKAGDDLTDREALGVSLAERIALDPHTVTDDFFEELRQHFTDDEIVEMVFACGIFNWGNKFNITMNLDAEPESEYETGMEYRQDEIA
jgi:alkylhydroperoxidase family enzyme